MSVAHPAPERWGARRAARDPPLRCRHASSAPTSRRDRALPTPSGGIDSCFSLRRRRRTGTPSPSSRTGPRRSAALTRARPRPEGPPRPVGPSRPQCRALGGPLTDLAPAPRRREGAPFVSVVVPARDEERAIEAATWSKCRRDDPAFEVVVVDDRSSDGTRGDLEAPREGRSGTRSGSWTASSLRPTGSGSRTRSTRGRAPRRRHCRRTGSSSPTRTSCSRPTFSRGRSRTPRETAWTS